MIPARTPTTRTTATNPVGLRPRRPGPLKWGLGWFLVLQVGFWLLAYSQKPEWVDPEFGLRVQQQLRVRRERPAEPRILALGSSRLQMALNPLAGPSLPRHAWLYNGGASGAGPRQILENAARYEAWLGPPAAYILEVLPALFVQDLPQPALDPLQQAFPLATYRLNLMADLGLARWLPRDQRRDFYWKQLRPAGWMPYFHRQVSLELRERGWQRTHQEYAQKLQAKEFDATTLAAWQSFLEQQHRAGRPVLLVLWPESPRYRALMGAELETQLAACRARWSPLAAWSDQRRFTEAESDFADGHHLMMDAAERFSRDWITETVQPWLARELR